MHAAARAAILGAMRHRAALLVACALLLAGAPAPAAADDDAVQDRVRTAGPCPGGGERRLELRARDGTIAVRFALRHAPARGVWRLTLVHERRVAWRGTVRVRRAGDTLRLARRLPDLGGPDRVSVRAQGPRGAACTAAATLPA